MDNEWALVKEFQITFNHPTSDYPKYLDPERVDKRYHWMLEELNEFRVAKEIVGQADAMIDLIYFALGTMVEMGIKPDNLFRIVHQANMSKLWEDGKPHYYIDGKVKKPGVWQDPHDTLEACIKSMFPKIKIDT